MKYILRKILTGAQQALHFRGRQFSWNFIDDVILLIQPWYYFFCKRSHMKFSSQHFRRWELFSFNQDADRMIRTEQKLVAFNTNTWFCAELVQS